MWANAVGGALQHAHMLASCRRAGTQGLGYVTGFLLLVVPPDEAARMLHRIGSDPKYTPGYWKGQPECFVRDAMVRLSAGAVAEARAALVHCDRPWHGFC